MNTQGARLKQIRLEKGLTLEQVHARTKIHIDILKALEEDTFVNLNPVYRKSFLKIYCKFLGVNPDEFIEQIPSPSVPTDVQSQQTTVMKSNSRLFTTRRASFPSTTGSKDWLFKIALRAVTGLSIFLILFSVGRFFIFHFKKTTQKTVTSETNKKTKLIKTTSNLPDKSAVVSNRPKTQPSIFQEQQEVLVSIQALDDVWMQVSVDGKLVFQNVLRRGRTESWRAKEKVVFGTIGSAASVRLVVNNKVYENLGSRRQIIKDLVVTSDGRLISSNR